MGVACYIINNIHNSDDDDDDSKSYLARIMLVVK